MQPFFNFQGSEIFAVLSFMGTALALLACGAILLVALATGRRRWVARAFTAALALVVVYSATLLGFSLSSRQQVLALGQEKYFCEVDCHLAYAVVEVQQTPVLGIPPRQASARGVFHVAHVRVRFDPNTITPQRGNFPLVPNPRQVAALDFAGRRFPASVEGQQALAAVSPGAPSLTDPLRPGESYVVALVFDLPADVSHPQLLILEDDWRTRLLIGHENSFLHKKTSFQLKPEFAGIRP